MYRVVRRVRGTQKAVAFSGLGCALALAAVAPASGAGAATTGAAGRTGHAAMAPAVRAKAARVGTWSKAFNPPANQSAGIAMTLLNNGNVLILGSLETLTQPHTAAYIYNPRTHKGHNLLTPAEIFCGAIVPLSDGRLLSVGGASTLPKGIPDIWLYNPANGRWTRQPDTPLGRYYPTATKLPSGRVMITAGTEKDGVTPNPKVEIYTPPARGKSEGTLKVVGPDHTTGYYPWQTVMPDGKVLQVKGGRAYKFDPAAKTWTSLGRLPAKAGNGAAGIMLPGGPKGSNRVMTVGGLTNGTALAATEKFNYGNLKAGWALGHATPQGRAHMNLVQVPNGYAFGIGGNSSGLFGAPHYQTLRYNPTTDTWTGMASQSVRRAYHSTALLLPSGRILSAGDTGAGGGGLKLDVYTPPYLFKGARPVIASAPTRVRYGAKFRIGTSGRKAAYAVLMAPGSTTHADEMNARRVRLAVKRTATGFAATAPTANIAPPGYYMLFTVTAGGVPSKAHWIHVGRR